MSNIRISKCQGHELQSILEELGSLRIEIFREYPYLYAGTLDYEREYLRTYVEAPRSAVFLAMEVDTGKLVGASTCIPMIEEQEEFQEPFLKQGYTLDQIFYFGESILLPQYRGCGIGKLFFDHREAHALQLGFKFTTFCAVDRPVDHPLRPANYRSLEGFWETRGYKRQAELVTHFSWRETGAKEESLHPLTFWTKSWKS